MSRALLDTLTNGHNGLFRQWLDNFEGDPRIAWYPSACEDFCDLLYLSEHFNQLMPPTIADPKPPDLFLHTDYYPWGRSDFLDSMVLHDDTRTKITIESIEKLPRCDLPLHKGIVDFPRGSKATGNAIFMMLNVSSHVLGEYRVPVLYVFAENAAFYAEVIEPNQGCITHLVKVRYGGGCGGGGQSSGVWLHNVLRQLGCEVFIHDRHGSVQRGDQRVYEEYPSLQLKQPDVTLQTIRILDSARWSSHGDIHWQLVDKG